MTDAAAQQVCFHLANRLGLGQTTPRVIGRFSNLAVALDPLPIVARIATGTALLRDTRLFAQREVAITAFLADRGAPVVPPCPDLLSGPHDVDRWTVTLWQRVSILSNPPDPVQSGRRLAFCHLLLRHYPESLPHFSLFDELKQLLAHPHVQQVLTLADREMIAARSRDLHQALEPKSSAAQPLHGDAHRKNVLHTPAGPLWTDWEDTIVAPVEWDLACLVTSARVTGQDREWAETALVAYGSHDATTLDLCIQVRALFGVAWLALLSLDNPARLERIGAWLNWLRQH